MDKRNKETTKESKNKKLIRVQREGKPKDKEGKARNVNLKEIKQKKPDV